MPRTRLTQDEKDEIVRLYLEETKSIPEILVRIGRPQSKNAVWRILTQEGLREEQDRSNYREWHPTEEQRPTFEHFRGMHRRAKRDNLEIDKDFSYSENGFNSWYSFIGPIPTMMRRPSVGRKEHSIGYLRDNFEWQEMGENTAERNIRNPRPTKAVLDSRRI